MTRFILPALLLAAVATPVLAETSAREIRFTHDRTTYAATISERGGVETIVGREIGTGRSFSLQIARGHVTGLYDGAQIAYDLADVAPSVDRDVTLSAR